ncbi:uncharacterized protein BRD3OS [Petromyzon marinus]
MTTTATTATTASDAWDEPGDPGRGHPLAALASSEEFARTRYRDTSRLVWERQRHEAATSGRAQLEGSYLLRRCGVWTGERGNQAVLVRGCRPPASANPAKSTVCSLM